MAVTLSILGLYNYDNTIFDGLTVPDVFNRDTVINRILLDLAEVEILYANPITMKNCITLWSGACAEQWQHIAKLFEQEYNPIYNYDRTEEHTIDESENISRTGRVTGNGSNTEVRQTAAFNTVGDPQTTDRVTDENTAEQNANSTDEHARTGNNKIRAYGNIGVTTTAQMIEGEKELWKKFNFYDILVEDFKTRFCVMVY